jgi:hypothetical protein
VYKEFVILFIKHEITYRKRAIPAPIRRLYKNRFKIPSDISSPREFIEFYERRNVSDHAKLSRDGRLMCNQRLLYPSTSIL